MVKKLILFSMGHSGSFNACLINIAKIFDILNSHSKAKYNVKLNINYFLIKNTM